MSFAPHFPLCESDWKALNSEPPWCAVAPETLHALLTEAWAAAREAWPAVTVAPLDFFRAIAARLPEAGSAAAAVEHAVRRLPLGDLYVARGCLVNDRAACAAFDRKFMRGTLAALARFNLPDAVVEDIQQSLHEQLLVRKQLDAYRATGGLQKWLNVIASREALHWLRAHRREEQLNDPLLELFPLALESPEAGYIQATYEEAIRQAFAECVAALSKPERSMLRQRFVFGMTLAEIARLRGVHEASASRAITQLKHDLIAGTRARLIRTLRIGPADLESVLRAVTSQFDLGLTGLLRDD